MYTQCPECGTAFRVTAEVLKVAAGKVRCGGCANAFNALEYLSEEMPEQKTPAAEVEPQLPELTPEPPSNDGGLPESISAEQSAALLKTLDQLAGSDIRIEDTGVEWMVLEDDEKPAPLDIETPASAETNAADFDEILDESPTPVDEFLTNTPEVVDSPEIFDESANAPAQTPVEELRFDDNTPLPEDFGFGDEVAVSAPAAEPEPEPEAAEPQPDITLSDPHEWTDILDEFEELAGEAARPLDEELDALLEQEDEVDADDGGEDTLLDELEAEYEDELEDEDEDEPVEDVDDDTVLDELDAEPDSEESEDLDEEDPDDDDDEEFLDEVDDDPQLELIEEPEVEEHDIEAELALDDDDVEDVEDIEDAEDADEEDDSGEHYIPPMSEEEQTVNMQIDQDLLAIAIEDDDGFASTIVMPEDWNEQNVLKSKDDDSDDQDSGDADDDTPKAMGGDTGTGFETIIMEGAEVKSALDEEKRAADVAEAAELQEIAKAAEAEAAKNAGANRYGMIAGVVVLVIVLLVQILHHSREALATNQTFNDTVGPIYRALGKPLQPAWDITGWQFEVTRGSAEIEPEGNSTETNETLTVYSRIGNNSESPLPYPLIRISLTDRFQEALGSHVLEPNDYLGGNMDPRKLVEPGESFEAAITVASRSEDATGFRLDVCYRHTDHQLRCKDENFK